MRRSVLLLGVCLFFAAVSQAVENTYDVKDVTCTVTLSADQFPPGLHGGSPDEGFPSYVFENNAPLKAEDSMASETILLLNAGLPVQVLAPTVRTAERNQFREKWFEVEVSTGVSASVRGYVWGGSLSYASAKKDVDHDGKEELFLAGITGFHGFYKTAELRLIKNGLVAGQCSFNAIETTMYEDTERFFSYDLSIEPLEKAVGQA